MSKLIKNRSEILFIYDVTDANPNGDPVDENKPRIDEETGVNIVTDVRLKRTIRDYLINFKDKRDEIFVKEIIKDDGTQMSRDERIELEDIKTLEDKEKLMRKYIDLRLFGATIGLKGKKSNKEDEEKKQKGTSITWTGPVQFKYGRSLHKVTLTFIKGTTVIPSKEGLAQGTFTERYILPYSLIAFYGIVNENAAQQQGIELTEEDILLMLEGIWNGTKNLISGSKFGQMPRLLMQVIYKEGSNFYIGELDKRISIHSTKNSDEEIRSISDLKVNITDLIKALDAHKDKVEKIRLKVDERLLFVKDEKDITIREALSSLLPVEDLVF
ncbi:type I-B CRISPR-associated protein Cas7/Csh2 [Calditerrivibrio nitroreducens]|uniref:Type I-B CRISPR-associated protein Cas7/Csh2 n=1 Tax=Calditerrivibrio nitroreducens TaxID=477976 RepID=A0A2J6WGE4_9BACT|nr:MAG: type I-B CRISPR-associated protein Cas7/Csh2 [Calditerrivibrio nitroreducens]